MRHLSRENRSALSGQALWGHPSQASSGLEEGEGCGPGPGFSLGTVGATGSGFPASEDSRQPVWKGLCHPPGVSPGQVALTLGMGHVFWRDGQRQGEHPPPILLGAQRESSLESWLGPASSQDRA